MTVAAARDCGELLELLGRQCAAYEMFLGLSKAQPRVFEAGGVQALMKLISKKHEIICQLRVTDRALEPYTQRWEATESAMPSPIRREVANCVERIAELIGMLKESESAIRDLVARARDGLSESLRKVSGGRRVAKAYSGAPRARAGRIVDGKS